MPETGPSNIPGRKADHVRLAVAEASSSSAVAASSAVPAGFGDVTLVHNAVPEVDLASIDPGVAFLGWYHLVEW